MQGGTEKTLMKPLVMEFFSLKPFKMSKERAWAHTFLVMVMAGLSRLCGFVTLTPVIVVSRELSNLIPMGLLHFGFYRDSYSFSPLLKVNFDL